jgi:hypothetical protein
VTFKYIILVSSLFLIITSCTQKKGHETGGFQTIDVTKKNHTGFDNPSSNITNDPLFLYLKGCYKGNMDKFFTAGDSNSFPSIFIDTRGLDVDGWANGDVRVSIGGTFNKSFNIENNPDSYLNFTTPVTSQVIEYWKDDESGLMGGNLSLEIENLSSGALTPSSIDGCEFFGKPIRLDLRLVFEVPEIEGGDLKKTEVLRIIGGSFMLYYANIQKAYARKGDPRSENPRYCCTSSPDWIPDGVCSTMITLDKSADLSYFTGGVGELVYEPNCEM